MYHRCGTEKPGAIFRVSQQSHPRNSVHLPNKSIDVVFPIPVVTAFDVMLEFAGSESTGGIGQLERPQKVVCLLEIGSDGEDLVDQVLHTDNAIFTQVILDELIVGERNPLFVDLTIPTLVNKLTNRLQVRIAVGDERIDDSEHFLCGLCEAHKDAIIELEKSKELHNFSGFGGDLVDTRSRQWSRPLGVASNSPFDANHKGKLRLLIDIEAALLLAQSSKSDFLSLGIAILLHI